MSKSSGRSLVQNVSLKRRSIVGIRVEKNPKAINHEVVKSHRWSVYYTTRQKFHCRFSFSGRGEKETGYLPERIYLRNHFTHVFPTLHIRARFALRNG